jgi:hypothetical protein
MAVDEQIALVERRLGKGTAALYARVLDLLHEATRGDTPTRAAIRKLIINLMCGAYHDYRSDAIMPKGDLVEVLRAIPEDPPAAHAIKRLIADALRGVFDEDEDEGRKWRERMTRDRVRDRALQVTPIADARPIALTPVESNVLQWMNRYVEVYGRPPTVREVGAGVNLSSTRVSQVLDRLSHKQVVTNIGGSRGWIPTKAA